MHKTIQNPHSMATMMNVDHGLTLQQWVDDPNQQDKRLAPQLIANLRMAVGSWEELDNFIYKNGNDSTLGDRYFSKITYLLGAEGDMNASLQWFMKECSVAAGFPNIGNGYQNVHQYEQAQPLSNATRSVKYGFGAQKGNEQWHAKLRKAFHCLKTKAEEAAATGGGTPVPPPMMASHLMPPQGNLPQGNPPQVMTPQGMPPQGMTGTPQYAQAPTPTGMYAHYHPPVQTPALGMFSPPTTPHLQQSMYHSHHAFNGGLNSTYGGVPGTPSNNYPHTPSGPPSSMHAPTPAKGSSFSGEEENYPNGVGAPSSSGLGDVAALSRAVRGLDFGAASSLRSVNDDVSSIGGTVDTLFQTTKLTEKQLMDEAKFRAIPFLRSLLDSQHNSQLRKDSKESSAAYQKAALDVVTHVKEDEVGVYHSFKATCEAQESMYDKEKQQAESKIKETKGTLKSEALDFEEQKSRLQAKSKEKEDELDAECKATIANLRNEIAKLENQIELLPRECEEKKARVNAECLANITKLQNRHEEQERILNRKLQSYETAKEQSLAEKVENLAYAMAHVLVLELTHEIFKLLKGPMMENQEVTTKLVNDIKSSEDKLDGLLAGIASHAIGTLADLLWNYPFADIP